MRCVWRTWASCPLRAGASFPPPNKALVWTFGACTFRVCFGTRAVSECGCWCCCASVDVRAVVRVVGGGIVRVVIGVVVRVVVRLVVRLVVRELRVVVGVVVRLVVRVVVRVCRSNYRVAVSVLYLCYCHCPSPQHHRVSS